VKSRKESNTKKCNKVDTTYLSIVTLKDNDLNSPIKKHGKENWIRKQDTNICCIKEMHLTDKNKH
jgi:hypothetical protein